MIQDGSASAHQGAFFETGVPGFAEEHVDWRLVIIGALGIISNLHVHDVDGVILS